MKRDKQYPLAEAIVQGIQDKGIELGDVQFFEAITVQAMVCKQ